MNHHFSNFEDERSWDENLWKDLKVETSLKFHMIFYRFLTFAQFKRGNNQNSIYKLSIDHKISSSLM